MAAHYLWLKGLHVAFMVTWFAGLFYLPRLFIYHQGESHEASRLQFQTMERRLFAIMSIGALLTLVLGLWLLFLNPGLLELRWFQLKVALLTGLGVYHYRCYLWIGRLRQGVADDDTRWLRWFNEIPVIFLLGIVLLAVAKPSL